MNKSDIKYDNIMTCLNSHNFRNHIGNNSVYKSVFLASKYATVKYLIFHLIIHPHNISYYIYLINCFYRSVHVPLEIA